MKRALWPAIGLAVLLVAVGCRSRRGRHAHDVPLLKPLGVSSWLVDLEVPGFLPAKLAVPVGAFHPRQIVIALHGAADRPEWTCGALRGIAGATPFVLCPSGIRRNDFPSDDARYSFGSVNETERELRASLGALKSRFGAYLKSESVTLAGFELGAERAAWIAREEPAFFARVMLIDPAPGDWSSTAAALFAGRGGKRLLIACHGAACRDDAELRAALTRRGGAEARVLDGGEGGPILGAQAVAQIAGSWAWLQASGASKLVAANGPVPPAVAAPSK